MAQHERLLAGGKAVKFDTPNVKIETDVARSLENRGEPARGAPGQPDFSAAPALEPEIQRVAAQLRAWFPDPDFVGAARIADHPIFPQESAIIARAAPRRREEFSTGRWLCRQGLRSFGYPDSPILVGRLQNPVWPDGVTGALSHDGELCATVLRRLRTPAATGRLGIDLIELNQRGVRMADLAPLFLASAGELGAMKAFGVAAEPALLLFSLKESIVKAVSSQINDYIDLRSIEVHDPSSATIAGRRLEGEMRAAATQNFLLTAAMVE